MKRLSIILRNITAGMLLSAGAMSCVSAGKYHELEDSDARTRQQLATDEARITELEGKLGIASTERTKLEGSVTEMKTALEDAQKRKQESDKRLAEFRDLTAKFKSLVDAGKLKVRVVKGRMMLALPTDILFPSGSARLSAAGKLALKEVAGVLASIPGKNFQIDGHTDNVPIHSSQFPSNWELASARAMTVLKSMEEAGMAPERISAASYGSTQPVVTNDTDEGKAANRRIDIVAVPDLTALPGFDELNRISSEK